MRKRNKEIELNPEWMAVFRHPLWVKGRTLGVLSGLLLIAAVVCVVVAINSASLADAGLITYAAGRVVGHVLYPVAFGFAAGSFVVKMLAENFRSIARKAVLAELGLKTTD